jgi:AraC-like DNA-binding protein
MAKVYPRDPRAAASYALVERLSPFVRIGREDWRGPWFIPQARILDYLLVYIAAGTGRFSVANDHFDVAAGDLIWIPPDTFHEMRGHPPKMLVAYLHFDLVYNAERSPHITPGYRYSEGHRKFVHPPCPWPPISTWVGRLPVVNGDVVYGLMKRVILESLGAQHPLRMAGSMLELLGEIDVGLSPAATNAGAHFAAMRRAARQIVGQPEGALDLGTLARGVHLSLSHFRKLFRETHGESPRSMHDRARMQKACELVLHSGSSITEIASRLGFSTVHNFSRAFKREIGVSPRSYRERTYALRGS